MVDGVGLVVTGIELPGQREEWLGVVDKEGDVKYGCGVWDLVLLEVVIETSAWCSGEREGGGEGRREGRREGGREGGREGRR